MSRVVEVDEGGIIEVPTSDGHRPEPHAKAVRFAKRNLVEIRLG
jgi:hypothetical protein